MCLHAFAVDRNALPAEDGRPPPGSIERRGRIDFTDPVVQRDGGRLRRARTVVQAGPADGQEVRLHGGR